MRHVSEIIAVLAIALHLGCDSGEPPREFVRGDDAVQIPVSITGSLQNGAWSPEGDEVVFTRFRKGYNKGPADLYVCDLDGDGLRTLVADGSGNVSLPGSAWNAQTGLIVFSSSREPHDEIFVIPADGAPGDEQAVTSRDAFMAYEPSFSPDGQWVVFESHPLDVEGHGVITKSRVDGTEGYFALTGESDDCRQPNWSPAGDLILYQRYQQGRWDIWTCDTDGADHRRVTSGEWDDTDASFSPDGQHIVYSSNEGNLEFANIFVIPVGGGPAVRVTDFNGYDGAPSSKRSPSVGSGSNTGW